MSNQEFNRLMGFYLAQKHAPKMAKRVTSKRTSKKGYHLGQGAMSYQNSPPKGVYPVVTPSSKI